MQPIPSGQWRGSPGAIATLSAAVDIERAQLVWLPPGQALQALGVYVNVGVADTDLRLGIRADSTGLPGALLLDAGIIAATPAGVRALAITFTVPAGPATGVPLWLTVTPQGTNTVSLVGTVTGQETRDLPNANSALLYHGTVTQGGVTGALPAGFTPNGYASPGPAFAIQAA
ncbi:hypothetical protein [Micromonospora costi]|uniref:hypothetical protein n=1 Tax=Micromonospora costi TaxID=1530042 RepID=UPI0011C3537B|nr:hypothetical protein [Micromonospora costi]